MILPVLIIAPSADRGRGVFTSEPIPARTVIEISPVLVLSEKDRAEVEKTILYDYIFAWGTEGTKACVAFGYLSMYNHAFNANCDYEMDFDAVLMTIKTLRNIEKGEELYINYTTVTDDPEQIWFDVK
jgi:SET domain-containing protein